MAPHDEGETQAFVYALEACNSALFPSFDDSRVEEEDAREALATVRRLMDTGGGSLAATGAALSAEDRAAFSEAVDVLATYFDRAVWCD